MSTLVLELKQGEVMILNGATLRFKTRARIELSTRARFLFGKQIMAEEDARTPAKQVYYALQTAYVGGDGKRQAALVRARGLIETCRQVAPSEALRELLSRMLGLIESDGGFDVLKLARDMIRQEAELLAEAAAPV